MKAKNTIIISPLSSAKSLLKKALPKQDYTIVFEGDDLQQLIANSSTIKPDLIVIALQSSKAGVLGQLKIINDQYPLPIVVFTKDDQDDAIERAIEAGVSAYIVDGLIEHRILPIIRTALARFKQNQSMQQEMDELRSNLADRKIIDRAKGLIMAQRLCTEDEAYKLLRSSAMNQNIRLADLAQNIISTASLLDTKTNSTTNKQIS